MANKVSEGIEFVPRRDVPYGQPYSVWHKKQICKFCYTESEARNAYAAVILQMEEVHVFHEKQMVVLPRKVAK